MISSAKRGLSPQANQPAYPGYAQLHPARNPLPPLQSPPLFPFIRTAELSGSELPAAAVAKVDALAVVVGQQMEFGACPSQRYGHTHDSALNHGCIRRFAVPAGRHILAVKFQQQLNEARAMLLNPEKFFQIVFDHFVLLLFGSHQERAFLKFVRRRLVKQKQKLFFESYLSHIETKWSQAPLPFPGRLPVRSRGRS